MQHLCCFVHVRKCPSRATAAQFVTHSLARHSGPCDERSPGGDLNRLPVRRKTLPGLRSITRSSRDAKSSPFTVAHRRCLSRCCTPTGARLPASCIGSAGCWHDPSVTPEDVAKTLIDDALDLQREVLHVAALFEQTNFLGDSSRMPYAHYGYLMAILGQIDTLSLCCGKNGGKGLVRLRKFLDEYMPPGKRDVNPVAVKMLRHVLMHTGALRYLYEEKGSTAYTWRIDFGELPADRGHYTVTNEDLRYQDYVINLVGSEKGPAPKSVKALNLSLTNLAADLVRMAQQSTVVMLASPQQRGNAVAKYKEICVQKLDRRLAM